MRPILIPLAQHVGRLALRGLGIPSDHVRTPSGSLHIYDAPGKGDLPTTVLLHGLASAATQFAPLLRLLHRDVKRIVAPDLPGHGFSPNDSEQLTVPRLFDHVAGALDAALTEPAIVIGNSLGGALAIRYALERPSRVRALILLSPAGARATETEWRDLRTAFEVKTRAGAKAFLRRIYHQPPWFSSLIAHEIAMEQARPAIRDLLRCANNDHAPTAAELASLEMPIFLFWGRSERLLPETHFEFFRRHLPRHAVVERPEGFGHCPHFDSPAQLAGRIVRFARASTAGATRPPAEMRAGLDVPSPWRQSMG